MKPYTKSDLESFITEIKDELGLLTIGGGASSSDVEKLRKKIEDIESNINTYRKSVDNKEKH